MNAPLYPDESYLKCMVCNMLDKTVTSGHKDPYPTRHEEPHICIRVSKNQRLGEVVTHLDAPAPTGWPLLREAYDLTEEELRQVDDAVHAWKVRQMVTAATEPTAEEDPSSW